MKVLTVKNPYSGSLLAELPFSTPGEISSSLQTAKTAFQKWRHSTASERSQLLNEAASLLESQKEEFSSLICQEAGKPIQLARTEVNRAIGVLLWAAAETQRFSGELLRIDLGAAGRTGFGIHTRFPRGVALGITPFNFPLNLVMHKIAPALACGCTILIKPSPFTPLTALKIAKLFETISPGLVQVVLPNDEESANLTRASEIAQISFTGSSRIGWLIRQQAPQKPTSLELGGNAWVIVMEDTSPVHFPSITKRIAGAAFGYAGQSCISVQNVAIASSLWPEFQKQLKKTTESTSFGDPSLSTVVSGPVISHLAAERIQTQLKQLPQGAELISSKKQEGPSDPNLGLIPPTLIILEKDNKPGPSPSIVQEEIFAPVMIAQEFTDLPKLTEQINSSRYGLQAGIYTQNWSAIERLYRELEVGGIIVNDVPTTRYDHQPYGGVKDSGQGREGIKYAMEEMTESKFLALSSQILG